MNKKKRSNKNKILAFCGKGGMDDKKIAELKEGWKRWTEKYS